MPGLLLNRSRGTSCTITMDSTSPTPTPTPPPSPSILRLKTRRTFSRKSPNPSPSPAPEKERETRNEVLQGIVVPVSLLEGNGMGKNGDRETDMQCWKRMLELQRVYHCYNSARLEAAVEAVEGGWRGWEELIPSRLCLDLLNEELKQHIVASQELLLHQQWTGYEGQNRC